MPSLCDGDDGEEIGGIDCVSERVGERVSVWMNGSITIAKRCGQTVRNVVARCGPILWRKASAGTPAICAHCTVSDSAVSGATSIEVAGGRCEVRRYFGQPSPALTQ